MIEYEKHSTSVEQRVLARVGFPEVVPLVHRILWRGANLRVFVVGIHSICLISRRTAGPIVYMRKGIE